MTITRVMIAYLLLMLTVLAQAQEQSTLVCGDTLTERFFSDDLLHEYTIDVDSSTRLIIHTDPLPLSAEITLSVEVRNGNGGIIPANRFAPEDGISTIETDAILSDDAYQVIITGNMPGVYQIFVSCVNDGGEVISNNNLVQSLSCGEQIDNTMSRPDELHRYYLYLEDSTVLDVFLEALYGNFAEMTFEMGLYSPTNQELNRITEDFRGIESQIVEQTITDTGVYRLYVQGFDGSGEDYRIAVDCTLPDGSLAISGGDNRQVLVPTILETDTETLPESDATADDFPVSDLIEGIPNTGQVTTDETFMRFAFDGTAGEQLTLQFSRLRGDSGLDMALLDQDSVVLFNMDLTVISDLSATVTIPADDGYLLFFALTGEDDVAFSVEIVRDGS